VCGEDSRAVSEYGVDAVTAVARLEVPCISAEAHEQAMQKLHCLLLCCTAANGAALRVAPVAMLAERQKKMVANNKLARRNYEILEDFEAGISLVGTEVKSCRMGQCQLRDGYCRIQGGECWLHNVNIARHMTAGAFFQHEELRPRRLLLHKREIRKLADAVDRRGLTIVPLSCYFNEKSFLKVSIGLARGKKKQDKREDIKRRDIDRDTARQIKAFG
jgi:SsrA-binding protein